jgi:site-specific DNA recombinase
MPSANGSFAGPKRVVLYARVSTEEQARSGFSLAQQIEALRDYAAGEGYKILEEVKDPGQSGASLERPGMDRVRDLVGAGGVAAVLAQDRDRFSREPAYTFLLRREFGEQGCELRALNDRGDGSPEGELTDGILDQLAKYERAKIAERSRRGRLRKAREGKLLRNGRANYGFRHTEAGDAYEVHEPEMMVVRRIFRSVANGSTLYGVKRTLETERVPPPGNGDKGGKFWSAAYLRRLVLDDVYTPYPFAEIEPLVAPAVAAGLDPSKRYGIFWFNRTRTTRKRVSTNGSEGREYRWKYHVHKNPRDQWIAIPIPEAGIPRELVEAARETIRHNRPPGSTGRRVWQIPSGAVRCSGCGTSMTQYASAAGGRIYAYYRCARLARLGKGSCPSIESPGSRKNHRAETVEGLVWEFVSELMKDPERLREDLERMIELEVGQYHGDPESAERAWLEKLAELNGMRRGFQEQAARNLMTLDELAEALEGLDETRRTAEEELAAVQGHREALENLERDKETLLEHYARIAPEALDSLTSDERHYLYRMLRLRVSVRPDTSLEVSGVFGEDSTLSNEEFVPRYLA